MKVKLVNYMMPDIVGLWNSVKPKPERRRKNEAGLNDVLNLNIPLIEFITFIFSVYEAPIAFREQLVRNRIGVSYFIQSGRITDYTKEFKYYIPEFKSPVQKKVYCAIMEHIKEGYKQLIRNDVIPEQARFVIPLNMLHRILICINLRALKNMFRARTCFIAQSDLWQPFLHGVMEEFNQDEKLCLLNKFLFMRPCESFENGKVIFKGCKNILINEENIKRKLEACPLWEKEKEKSQSI